jgi:hypothetical protein
MFRFWKLPVITAIALGSMFMSTPAASAQVTATPVAFRVGFRGGWGYGGGWYGPRWGWGWGPGWYAWGYPGYYGYGFYGPSAGKVKIVTHDKNASVYVDGGLVGPLADAKKFPLRPGDHDIELRDLNGRTLYHERVNVIPGRTVEVHPNLPNAGEIK